MGAPRRRHRRTSAIFGKTVDYVLKHAPCRVMVVRRPERGMSALPRATVGVFGVVFVVLGIAMIVLTRGARRRRRLLIGALFIALGAGRLYLLDGAAESVIRLSRVARKLPGLQRVLDAPPLFSVAYGEIASSIYFALGIVARNALGLTPVVLLAIGALFLLVALSYAEGTAAIPETGGAATFVRQGVQRPRRLHDRLGALPRLPDRDRAVGALRAALPRGGVPGRRARPTALGTSSSASPRSPASRRPPGAPAGLLHGSGSSSPYSTLLTQLLLSVLGFALLVSPDALTHGTRPRHEPDVALARLRAPAGDARLHRSRDGRQPGRGGAAPGHRPAAQPLLRAIGSSSSSTSRSPSSACPRSRSQNGTTALGDDVAAGAADRHRRRARHGHCRRGSSTCCVSSSASRGALILLAAITTSISGLRPARVLARRARQLPRAFGRLSRRTLVSPQARSSRPLSISIGSARRRGFAANDVTFLASLFCFGVLLAFTAAQLAVIRLRVTEPALPGRTACRSTCAFGGPECRCRRSSARAHLRRSGSIAIVTHAARALRGAGLARGRARRLRPRPARRAARVSLERVASPDEQRAAEAAVPADPRADEARARSARRCSRRP